MQHFGELEGRHHTELFIAAEAQGISFLEYVPSNGETNQQVAARAREFFDKLIRYIYYKAIRMSIHGWTPIATTKKVFS